MIFLKLHCCIFSFIHLFVSNEEQQCSIWQFRGEHACCCSSYLCCQITYKQHCNDNFMFIYSPKLRFSHLQYSNVKEWYFFHTQLWIPASDCDFWRFESDFWCFVKLLQEKNIVKEIKLIMSTGMEQSSPLWVYFPRSITLDFKNMNSLRWTTLIHTSAHEGFSMIYILRFLDVNSSHLEFNKVDISPVPFAWAINCGTYLMFKYTTGWLVFMQHDLWWTSVTWIG